MAKIALPSYQDFLTFFPKMDLPLNISPDALFEFSRQNTPLPQEIIGEFILEYENGIVDEFTEFIPCFYCIETEHFDTVVYWKGGLMKYEYILVCLDKKGTLLDRKVIAGTLSDGDQTVQSVAYISEDREINIMVGGQKTEEIEYNPETSRNIILEIKDDGHIDLVE